MVVSRLTQVTDTRKFLYAKTNISEVCAASVIVLGDVAYRVCNFVRLNESLYDTKSLLFLVVGSTERNFDTSTDNLQQIVGSPSHFSYRTVLPDVLESLNVY